MTSWFGGYAFLVAAGIFLSRIAGLIRQRVIAHFFGNSPALGAFWAAFRIPNFLQNLAGEQSLSASFIPVYARLLAEGKRELADRVAGIVGALLSLVVAGIVLLGVTLSPLLVNLLAPGYKGEVRELTIVLVRILFPGAGLLVMSAWCLGILNSHRRFFLSYVAPVLWNGAMIAALLLFGFRQSGAELAGTLAWGSVAGSALQVGIQVPFVLRYARDLRPGLDVALEPVRQVARNFIPVVLSRGVVQVSAFIDEIMASFLGTAAMTGLSYAQTLYLLPISLFGMSVAAAELPEMSSALGSPEEVHARLRERVRAGLRQIAFFVIPTVVAFLAIGAHLVAALYQTGRFGPDDSLFVWSILIGYALGLLAVTPARLYSSTFYALGDTRTPLRFALVRVVVGATLAYLLAFPLRPTLVAMLRDGLGFTIPRIDGGEAALGAVGLSLAAGLGSWVEFMMLRRALGGRIGPSDPPAAFYLKAGGAALAGGGVALLIAAVLPPLHPVISALILAGALGVVYLAGTTALHVQESGRILNIIRPRRR